MDEIDEEAVGPGLVGRSRLDPGQIRPSEPELGEYQSKSPRGVRGREHDRRLVVIVADRWGTRSEDNEPGGVVIAIHDVAGQDLEVIRICRPGWRQCGDARIGGFGDLPDGTGGVVTRYRLDTESGQVVLRLSKSLRVGPHLANGADVGTPYPDDGVANLHQVLLDNGKGLMLSVPWQAIEHRKHAPRRRVLYRNHQPIDLPCLQCGERGSKGRIADGLSGIRHFRHRPMTVRAGLALVANAHPRTIGRHQRAPALSRQSRYVLPEAEVCRMTSVEVDQWFADQQDTALLGALELARDVILSADDRVEESIKWKTPTFSYEGNIVSFTIGAKNFVSLMFHNGAQIPGNYPRLAGDGKQVRTMRFDDRENLADNRGDLEAVIKAWCDFRP